MFGKLPKNASFYTIATANKSETFLVVFKHRGIVHTWMLRIFGPFLIDLELLGFEDYIRQAFINYLSQLFIAGSTNPRILIVGKVLVSLCHSLPEGGASQGPKTNSYGMIIDTFATKDKSVFYKFNPNEMYPDHVLVYRDMQGPRDAHSSRLTDFIKHCQLSYRSGTRWNPQEQEFLGRKVSSMSVEAKKEDPDEIHVVKDKKRK